MMMSVYAGRHEPLLDTAVTLASFVDAMLAPEVKAVA
jgi:hypothetical protein